MEYKYFISYAAEKDGEIVFGNSVAVTDEPICADNVIEVLSSLCAERGYENAAVLNFMLLK
jgi:hypothetical protein